MTYCRKPFTFVVRQISSLVIFERTFFVQDEFFVKLYRVMALAASAIIDARYPMSVQL